VQLARLQQEVPAVARKKTRVVLAMLKEAGLVRERRGSRFAPGRRVAEAGELERLATAYRERGERDREKLAQMEGYARSAYCRWKVLHDYFGEEPPDGRCGVCDNCRRGIAELAGKPMEAPGN
jgi:ATP-dependent DNA helicase RecQ